jgi:hypothetical protein
MGLAERFAAPPRAGRLCKVGRILASLDPAARKAVEAALDGPRPSVESGGWSDPAIAAALTDEGYPVTDSTVRDHRIHACACCR